jgi:putative transposase
MKGKRYSTEEKVRILRDVDAGKSIVDICREKNISDVTYHRWRKQFGHMDLNEARRLKELERENTELKKMLADAMLAKKVLEYALEKKLSARGTKSRSWKLRAGGMPDTRAVEVGLLVQGRETIQPAAGAGQTHPRPGRREPALRVPQDRGPAQAGRLERGQAPGAPAAAPGGAQSAAYEEKIPS